jgi:hypothetical protein
MLPIRGVSSADLNDPCRQKVSLIEARIETTCIFERASIAMNDAGAKPWIIPG